MSSWRRGQRTTRRSWRCRRGGAGDARRAGRAGRGDVVLAARVTHDAQVAQVAAMSSCGAGDARRAGRRDVIVAAAPWELHAFFVPAAMCPRLVARRGQRTTRRSRRCRHGGCPLGAPRVLRARRDVLVFSGSARVTHDARRTTHDARRTTRRSPRCRRCGCSLEAPRVLRARCDVLAFGRSARAVAIVKRRGRGRGSYRRT
jgi:hypothetical protein